MPSAFLFFIALLFGILAPRSLYLVPLLAGLGGLVFYRVKRGTFPSLDKSLLVAFGSVCLLSFLSALWSVNIEDTLDRSLNTLLILGGGGLMISLLEHLPPFCDRKRQYFTVAFFTAYALCAGFLLFEYTHSFPVMNQLSAPEIFPSFGLNRSVVTLGLLFLPLLFMGFRMLRRRAAKMAMTIVTCGLILLVLSHTQSQTAQIALLSGILVYGMVYALQNPSWRTSFIKALTGIVCILIIATPLIPTFMQKQLGQMESTQNFVRDANILERLEIWTFMSAKIAERPLLGHGIEATKNLTADSVLPYNNSDNFLHPHNAFLQIWVETGLIGALLVCGLMIFMCRRIIAAPYIAQPLYLSMIASCLCMVSTGYGLWQSWHLGLILTAAALAIFVTKISARNDS